MSVRFGTPTNITTIILMVIIGSGKHELLVLNCQPAVKNSQSLPLKLRAIGQCFIFNDYWIKAIRNDLDPFLVPNDLERTLFYGMAFLRCGRN